MNLQNVSKDKREVMAELSADDLVISEEDVETFSK